MTTFDYGPVEFYAIGFDGDHPGPGVLKAIDDLVKSGTVNLLDLVFVRRSEDGELDIIEFADGCKTGEVSQSLIQNLALLAEIGFHVGIDGDRKWTFLAHQLKCRRGNEKAFE